MQSPGGAIRDGDYKLLEYFQSRTVQLFNLKEDIGEQSDFSKIEIQKTQALNAKLHQSGKEVDALEVDAETLRKRKSYMDENDYYEILESILLKLSGIYLIQKTYSKDSIAKG